MNQEFLKWLEHQEYDWTFIIRGVSLSTGPTSRSYMIRHVYTHYAGRFASQIPYTWDDVLTHYVR